MELCGFKGIDIKPVAADA